MKANTNHCKDNSPPRTPKWVEFYFLRVLFLGLLWLIIFGVMISMPVCNCQGTNIEKDHDAVGIIDYEYAEMTMSSDLKEELGDEIMEMNSFLERTTTTTGATVTEPHTSKENRSHSSSFPPTFKTELTTEQSFSPIDDGEGVPALRNVRRANDDDEEGGGDGADGAGGGDAAGYGYGNDGTEAPPNGNQEQQTDEQRKDNDLAKAIMFNDLMGMDEIEYEVREAWQTNYVRHEAVELNCSKAIPCIASQAVLPVCATITGLTYLNPGVFLCAQKCNKSMEIFNFGPCQGHALGPMPPSTTVPPPVTVEPEHMTPDSRLKIRSVVLQPFFKLLGMHVHSDGGFYLADEKNNTEWWNV